MSDIVRRRSIRKWSEEESEALLEILTELGIEPSTKMPYIEPHIAAILERVDLVRRRDDPSFTPTQVTNKIGSYGTDRTPKSKNRLMAKNMKLASRRFQCSESISEPTAVSIATSSDQDFSVPDKHLPLKEAISQDTSTANIDKVSVTQIPATNDNLSNIPTLHEYETGRSECYEAEDSIPWQERFYSSWQNYLGRRQKDILRSYEPLDHDKAEADVERLLGQVEDACKSLAVLLPTSHLLDANELWEVIMGTSGKPAIDGFRALSFDRPLLSPADRCCIFACAAIYKWIICDIFTPKYVIDRSNPLTSLILGFIQADCQGVWKELMDLNKQQWLSSMTHQSLEEKGIAFTNHLYNLFESTQFSFPPTMTWQLATTVASETLHPPDTDNFGKRMLYNSFISNMIQAMTTALQLRRDLERCSDLNYSFEFEKIGQPFEASRMQTRSQGDFSKDATTSILACLFPAIWSRAKDAMEDTKRLLTKAVVVV